MPTLTTHRCDICGLTSTHRHEVHAHIKATHPDAFDRHAHIQTESAAAASSGDVTPTMSKALVRATSEVIEGAACPTCSQSFAFGTDLVRCDQCQALHHQPCWDQASGCKQPTCQSAAHLCRFCHQAIKQDAVKCKHCGRYLDTTIDERLGDLDASLKTYLFKATGTTRAGMNTMIGIGMFVFGWLLPWAFSKLGRSELGWGYLLLVIVLNVFGRAVEPTLALVAPLAYIGAWVHANVILTEYQRLAHQRIATIDTQGGGVDSQIEKGLLLFKVLEEKSAGRAILEPIVDRPGAEQALVAKARQVLAQPR